MKKTPKKKQVILAAVLLPTLLGSIIHFLPREEGLTVSTCFPEIGDITETIPANGKLRPITEIKISPDVSGEIMELNCQEGDQVHKGDLLIKIRQDVYRSIMEQAEAALNSVRSRYLKEEACLQKCRATHTRDSILFSDGTIPKAEYEVSLTEYRIAIQQYRSAGFDIQSAEAALREAQENLTRTNIYSPMDGTISRLYVEKGERVVGTSQMAGTEMLRISDLNEMEVLVEVNERDLLRLTPGDSADIFVEACPRDHFKGIITQIANSALNIDAGIDQIPKFEVRLRILPESYSDLIQEGIHPFRPGMSATVNITTETKNNVITLPIECVTTRKSINFTDSIEAQNPELVFIVDGTQARAVRVKTGIQDFNRIEIREGIGHERKLEIIRGPYDAISRKLNNGTLINITNE